MRGRHCLYFVFGLSTALICLQNIYHTSIIQRHLGNAAGDTTLTVSEDGVLLPRDLTPRAAVTSAVHVTGPVVKGVLASEVPPSLGATKMMDPIQTKSGNNSAPQQNLLVDHRAKPAYIPLWQRRLQKQTSQEKATQDKDTYFLAELLQVRIYEDDKARWTIRELKQWLHYMFLAGVQHVYLCDHYKYEKERVDVLLRRYIDLDLVTYLPWGAVRHPMTAQLKCYQKMIDNYKYKHMWQIAVDMDEYPFSPIDTEEDFLIRYLQNITTSYKNPVQLTEISMKNYLMLGQGDRTRDMVIDRIDRMTPKPANLLVKPIYKPSRVRANLHHNFLQGGRSITANETELRMLHYWGARTQDWGPDTPHTLEITTHMDLMRERWAPQVRNSLLAFGEHDVFSSDTGP